MLNFNIGHESLKLIQPSRMNIKSMSNRVGFFGLVLCKRKEDEAPEQRFIRDNFNSAHVEMVQTFRS